MKIALMIGGLIGATFLAYHSSLSGPFVYDDRPIIANNPLIRRLNLIPLLFGTSYWGMNLQKPDGASGGLYRPLTMTSYALNYSVGGLDPHGYHLTNLFLHILCSFLLYFLCLRLGFSFLTSGAATILFALLPVHTEAVSNIAGRSEILSATFVILAWILALRPLRWITIGFGAMAFLCALLSKEIAAAFWPMLILSDILTSRKPWKEIVKKRLLLWIVYGGSLLLYLVWHYRILGQITNAGGIPYFTTQSFLQIFLTMARFMVDHYFVPLVLGVGFCADFTRPVLRDSGVQDAAAWGWGLFILSTIAIGFYTSIKKGHRWGWCVILFFGLLFPVSNLLVHLEVIGAERFLYLPSIGYCIGLGLLFSKAFKRHKNVTLFGLVALCLYYGRQTHLRDKVWATEESFWTTTVGDAPESARAWNGLGLVRMHQKEYKEAHTHFAKALSLNPYLTDAYYNMTLTYYLEGNWNKAETGFLALVRRNVFDQDTLLYLASISEKKGQNLKAAGYYTKILEMNPLNRTAARNLALLHCRTGSPARCRSELEHYLKNALPDEKNEDIHRFLLSGIAKMAGN